MPIRLAVSKPIAPLRYDRAQLRRMRLTRANDNAPAKAALSANGPANGNILHAALRHFAAHGLAAAQHAAAEARAAQASGDEAGYRWWRDICYSLDRRLASKLDQPQKDQERVAVPR